VGCPLRGCGRRIYFAATLDSNISFFLPGLPEISRKIFGGFRAYHGISFTMFAGKGGNVMLMTPDLQNFHEAFFLPIK